MKHVLVVDDDLRLQGLISTFLRKKGFLVTALGSVRSLDAVLAFVEVDLILLDVMLPDEDGFSFLKRAQKDLPPVIFLTARARAEDRVQGLRLGAGDYLIKPFEPEELFLRISKLIKNFDSDLVFGQDSFSGWRFCFKNKLLTKKGHQDVILTNLESRLLDFFWRRPNSVVSRQDLAEIFNFDPWSRSADVAVGRLRTKLPARDQKRSCLESVRHVGYRFQPDFLA